MYELRKEHNKVVSLVDFQPGDMASYQNNIATILDQRALMEPKAIAFIEFKAGGLKTTTYREFCRQVKEKASRLSNLGLGKGDVVLILQPISVKLYSSILACFRLGATVVFVDPSLHPRTINDCVAKVNPRFLIATPKYAFLASMISRIRSIPMHYIEGTNKTIFDTRVKAGDKTDRKSVV